MAGLGKPSPLFTREQRAKLRAAIKGARDSRFDEEMATRGDPDCALQFSGWHEAFAAVEDAIRKLK